MRIMYDIVETLLCASVCAPDQTSQAGSCLDLACRFHFLMGLSSIHISRKGLLLFLYRWALHNLRWSFSGDKLGQLGLGLGMECNSCSLWLIATSWESTVIWCASEKLWSCCDRKLTFTSICCSSADVSTLGQNSVVFMQTYRHKLNKIALRKIRWEFRSRLHRWPGQ